MNKSADRKRHRGKMKRLALKTFENLKGQLQFNPRTSFLRRKKKDERRNCLLQLILEKFRSISSYCWGKYMCEVLKIRKYAYEPFQQFIGTAACNKKVNHKHT